MSARTESGPRTVPDWLADMEFCHIDDGSELRSFCGDSVGEPTCVGVYHGEAICDACGSPTCPRCAQLCALEDAIEDVGA